MSLARPQPIPEPDIAYGVASPRLRTAGEILDDAWRLALADAPTLLSLSALFLVPCFAAVLALLAGYPPIDHWSGRVAMALLAAILAALTGIGSGACQDFLLRRSNGQPATTSTCLKAALRRGVDHAAARAMLTPVLVIGLGCLFLPGAMVWMAGVSVHILIATGKGRRSADLREIGREVRSNAAKTAIVVLSRVVILWVVMFNLHLFGKALVWVAESLAGLDFALVTVSLSLFDPLNWTYLIALTMFAWLLLAPYFEASNFLLHLDTRTRQEGLDLMHRVGRLFTTTGGRKIGAALALFGLLAFASAGQTKDVGSESSPVAGARVEVTRIKQEMKDAEPYPGSQQWLARLERIAGMLEKQGGKERFAWFRRRLTGFAALNREAALRVVDDLNERLGRFDVGKTGTSTDDLKQLLRPASDREDEPTSRERESKERREKERETKPEEKREVRRDAEVPTRRSTSGGPAAPTPAEGGSNAPMLIGGLLLALVAIALVLWFRNRTPTAATPTPTTGARPTVPEAPRPDLVEAPSLWRNAEALAAKGEFLEALRVLYAAVLSLLHRKRLVRYEPTRTNGEYISEVKLATEAPPGLQAPFERLTVLFETKWYGERTCDNGDFATGKGMAEEVRGLVG